MKQYSLVGSETLSYEERSEESRQKADRHCWPLTALLVISNLVCATGWAKTWLQHKLQHQSTTTSYAPHQRIAEAYPLPQRPVQMHWYTAYSTPNDTEADDLWNKISTAHGFIAVAHDVATSRNWAPSMAVPGDEDKGLYLLESYHQLHCLRIVRRLFFESQAGRPLSYPMQHVRHCFDAFRQFVMCHADPTPLYTMGHHTSGDGQWHVCNDWNALREYATQNSACFRDRSGHETTREQFGVCDDGLDGLIVDAPALDLSSIAPN